MRILKSFLLAALLLVSVDAWANIPASVNSPGDAGDAARAAGAAQGVGNARIGGMAQSRTNWILSRIKGQCSVGVVTEKKYKMFKGCQSNGGG